MIKLPAFFSDGMILNKKANIWGVAKPNQIITASFNDKTYEVISDANGRFAFVILSDQYGGPHTLSINDITIKDVYIGHVWLCGGQSNMEGIIGRTRILLPAEIIEDNRISFFQVEKALDFCTPATDLQGSWRTATDDMDNLFAVPYFFARHLLQNCLIDDFIHIGLICNPVGGSALEGWLPESIVSEYPYLREKLRLVSQDGYIEEHTETANLQTQEWYSRLYKNDRGIQEKWETVQYDDSLWESCALLDNSKFTEYGSVWLRKHIQLSNRELQNATLHFGRIENNVKVYINGVQVASVDYMYPPCIAKIPNGVLQEGSNTIAVRIVGDSQSPYIVPGKLYAIVGNDFKIDLSGEWKVNIGCVMEKQVGNAWFYGHPTGLYNAMMSPLLGYSCDGMIWYQGETNTGRPYDYKELFQHFVTHMRKYFGDNFPIIYNQLANFNDPSPGFGEHWASLREQQWLCQTITNTAMSVSIDCGEWNDIHPLDKKTVGDRMALHARRLVYGQNIISHGPIVKDATIKNETLTITFDYGVGLWAKNGYPILDIIDFDQNISKIYGAIDGETITANIGKIKVQEIRFGWVDCPSVTLYNAYNLPASPFKISID